MNNVVNVMDPWAGGRALRQRDEMGLGLGKPAAILTLIDRRSCGGRGSLVRTLGSRRVR